MFPVLSRKSWKASNASCPWSGIRTLLIRPLARCEQPDSAACACVEIGVSRSSAETSIIAGTSASRPPMVKPRAEHRQAFAEVNAELNLTIAERCRRSFKKTGHGRLARRLSLATAALALGCRPCKLGPSTVPSPGSNLSSSFT